MLPKWIWQFLAGPRSLERYLKQYYNTSVTENRESIGKGTGSLNSSSTVMFYLQVPVCEHG